MQVPAEPLKHFNTTTMKKAFFLFVVAALAAITGQAQKINPNKIVKNSKDTTLVRPQGLAATFTDVEVYPQPNYMGTKAYFKMSGGKLVPPFDMSNVSIRIPAGKIVYFKKCDTDIPYESAYDASQAQVNLRNVCGIRMDDADGFVVNFNGISTILHNNDCKRVFGKITVKVMETAPDGTTQSSMIGTFIGTSFRGPDAYTFVPFSNANANTTPPYSNYVHNSGPSGAPVITTPVMGPGTGESMGAFRAGANALREGRVSIIVTTNIASAHKTCNVCDDFSSNVHMEAPVSAVVPINKAYGTGQILNATYNRLVLGPYRAEGSRDGPAITASAGTVIYFRVHFTITEL